MAKARPAAVDAVQTSAKLTIDGKTYELVYDFNAIAEAERICGANLLHGIAATFLNTLGAAQMRGMLYAALQPRYPYRPVAGDREASGISLADAGRMIRVDTIERIVKALEKAWELSIPEPSPDPPDAGEIPAGD